MALAPPQLADLPGVSGRIRLARGKRKLRNRALTGAVADSTGWTSARAPIQMGLLEDIFMEPFLWNILRHDECAAVCGGLPGLERAPVCRTILGKH